jgi:DNA-binding CsgD family transcriptional regulator/tetratricopeptide (TPR) repeat protein
MAAMARVSSPTFVGRRSEVETMTAALIGSSGTAPVLMLLVGEAGVGKTRLVTEVTQLAESSGALVLIGGCVPLGEGTVPFAPIREAMRDLTRRRSEPDLDRLLGAGREELASLVPDISRSGTPSAVGPPQQQGRIHELILGLFERLAEEQPTILVLEDLHWADRSTLGLLSFLIRNTRAPGLRLLGTLRSDEVDRRHPLYAFLAEAGRSDRVARVDLHHFDRSETTELVRAILGTDPPAALADTVFRRSGGNAFFAEELLAAEAPASDLPDTLSEVLLTRVGQLPYGTQRILRTVAAAGRSVSGSRLSDVAGVPMDRLTAALRDAITQHVLVVETGGQGEDRYQFRHALVQEAIEHELLPSERRRLHAAFATSLAEHPASPADSGADAELAYHWLAAGELPQAFAASMAAAEAAERGYAFAEVQAHLEQALDLWERVPENLTEGLDRIALMERAAAAAAAVQAYDAAAALIQSAIDGAAADPIRRGVLHERLGRYSLLAADTAQADAAYREAVRLVPANPPTAERARVVAGLAQYLAGSSNVEAIRLCTEAIDVAHAVGAVEIEANASITRAAGLCAVGDIGHALEDAARGFELASQVAGSVEIPRSLRYISEINDFAGRLDLAVEAASRAFDEADRLGLARSEGISALSLLASALFDSGRWEEAELVLDRMERIGVTGWHANHFHLVLAHLQITRGDLDAAALHIAALDRLTEGDVEGEFASPTIAVRARLAVYQGQPGRVRAMVDSALGALGQRDQYAIELVWIHYWAIRAEADVANQARRRRRAHDVRVASDSSAHHVTKLESLAASLPSGHWMRGHIDRLRSMADAEVARLEARDAASDWVTAAEAWARAFPMHDLEAYARWRAGTRFLETRGAGARAAARSQLIRALEISTALKALPLRTDVERVAARAHLSLTDTKAVRGPTSGAFDLTPREREVLELVASGQSNREIGEALFIAEKTAGVHVSNVLGKLGVARRTEAVAVARKHGLLET